MEPDHDPMKPEERLRWLNKMEADVEKLEAELQELREVVSWRRAIREEWRRTWLTLFLSAWAVFVVWQLSRLVVYLFGQ